MNWHTGEAEGRGKDSGAVPKKDLLFPCTQAPSQISRSDGRKVSEETRNPPSPPPVTQVSLSLPMNSSETERERQGKREETW